MTKSKTEGSALEKLISYFRMELDAKTEDGETALLKVALDRCEAELLELQGLARLAPLDPTGECRKIEGALDSALQVLMEPWGMDDVDADQSYRLGMTGDQLLTLLKTVGDWREMRGIK